MGDRMMCAYCWTEVVNGSCPNEACTRPRRPSDEDLNRLDQLAVAATPGPWEVEPSTRYDFAPPTTTWSIPGLERWRGYTNAVGFGEDEATARFVAAVSPDVVRDLIFEVRRLRNEEVRLRAIAHLALGREVTDDDDGLVECWSCTVDRYASDDPCRYCGAGREWPTKADGWPATTTVTNGDMAIELPLPEDQVVGLMEALDRSVREAKAARKRHPQRRNTDG